MPKKVFISYSHKDEEIKKRLVNHFSGLVRKELIKIWDDRSVLIGEKWNQTITKNLENSDIILFLISPDFLASEYINEIEIKKTIKRHQNNEALIIPIFIRACDFESSVLSPFQGAPRDMGFVSSAQNEDEALISIVKEVKNLLDSFNERLIKPETISRITQDSCDTPPDINKWVGREDELKFLLETEFKVVFITGFGGQGKSALASKYVKESQRIGKYQIWDWRDFKEENYRLRTKIVQIIERFSEKKISFDSKEIEINELIDVLFDTISSKKILFVFDNIDSYVDYENFMPNDDLRVLIDKSLNYNHKSRFVFTCRPFIKKAEVNFFQLRLIGLKRESAIDLLKAYKIPVSKHKRDNLFKDLFLLTKGHPLWLHLLAAQATRGIDKLEKFITDIESHTEFSEDNISKILSDQIIDKLWLTLNDNQKKLLRCISELVRSEETSAIYRMMQSEMSWNKFSKSLKALKLLNLIESKTRENGHEEIELHPLVKSFIISKYPSGERNKFISIIIDYYNQITILLKERISGNEELSFYENWLSKVELAINKNDFENALIYMYEIQESVLTAGYVEEYVRISKLLFSRIDFSKHIKNETPYFKYELEQFADVLSQTSDFELARKVIDKYESEIKGKGKDYILLCKMWCRFYWNSNDFGKAIEWGEKASSISKEAGVESDDHTLNLAKRDSKEENRVKEALTYFLRGSELDAIVYSNVELSSLSAHYYGNIGRCLFILGDRDKAKQCYCRSYLLCYVEEHSDRFNNRGFIAYWIGQLFHRLDEYKVAYLFFRNSIHYWDKHNPNKAKQVHKELEAIEGELSDLEELKKMDISLIEKYCQEKCHDQIELNH